MSNATDNVFMEAWEMATAHFRWAQEECDKIDTTEANSPERLRAVRRYSENLGAAYTLIGCIEKHSSYLGNNPVEPKEN